MRVPARGAALACERPPSGTDGARALVPWTLLDAATVPGGGAIRLMRRGPEFAIWLDGNQLMSSRQSGSEQALAALTCDRLSDDERPRLLIGGLGMGFTLRAALAALGPHAQITVAELVPSVVAWARGPMAEILDGSLDDPRVEVVVGDVAALLRARVAAYDAILLDVDNGPEALTLASNDGLYGARGLRAAHAALRPGGILSVWSVAPDDAFAERMRKAAFSVEEIRVHAHGRRGTRHVIWIGRRG